MDGAAIRKQIVHNDISECRTDIVVDGIVISDTCEACVSSKDDFITLNTIDL